MDIKQQLQRLLDVTEDMRQHAQDLDAIRSGALSELDAAEYDLKQLISEICHLLPAGSPLDVPEPMTGQDAA